ncbi:DUF1801 domain-containing protein [Lacisediminihabitans sp. H27-G8]|uniref:DUF1801 domain-containing protein n=1 Tax=Lacisediminihabitans sp. H27-G8 TaxID=3111909 RepID=UPI0038FCABD3
MQANKTQPLDASVDEFIDAIENDRRRTDSRAILAMMSSITGLQPVMWGTSIVGFGSHHYVYASGREGDTPVVAFSPRKSALVLYSVLSAPGNNELVAQLGPHTTGKGCLYIRDLSVTDAGVLTRMIDRAFRAKGDPGARVDGS